MREKIILSLAGLGTLLLLWNFNTIFLHLGDDALQGAIFRIMFIHIPAAIGAYTFYSVAVLSSIIFLVRKNFKYDSLAVACVEVGQVFTLVNLVTGSIWGRIIWGIWWTWDMRLTTQLICFLLYLGYLLMRPAVTEPTQRATMSAILAIFAFADIPIVVMAIRLKNVRTQHPQPVLETGGVDASYWPPLLISFAAVLLIGSALVMIRRHQETSRREIDYLLGAKCTPYKDKDTQMDQALALRNFTYLVYGYSAAMLVVFGYVMLLVLRSRRIDRELTRLKSLVEDKAGK